MTTHEFDALKPGDIIRFRPWADPWEFRGFGPKGWMTIRGGTYGRTRRLRVISNTVTLMTKAEGGTP